MQIRYSIPYNLSCDLQNSDNFIKIRVKFNLEKVNEIKYEYRCGGSYFKKTIKNYSLFYSINSNIDLLDSWRSTGSGDGLKDIIDNLQIEDEELYDLESIYGSHISDTGIYSNFIFHISFYISILHILYKEGSLGFNVDVDKPNEDIFSSNNISHLLPFFSSLELFNDIFLENVSHIYQNLFNLWSHYFIEGDKIYYNPISLFTQIISLISENQRDQREKEREKDNQKNREKEKNSIILDLMNRINRVEELLERLSKEHVEELLETPGEQTENVLEK